MKKITIEISDTPYEVLIADTDETRRKGLMGVTSMPSNKGMLFKWDEEGRRDMWMKDTLIDLLQIFLNKDMEVIKTAKRKSLDEELVGCDGVQYVLELNADQNVEEGDEMEINPKNDDKLPVMKVLAPDGSTQMELEGGERIVSRKETKILIKKAKRAYSSKSDNDYKSLGKYMFKVLHGQDNRKPEYVEAPK